MDLTHIDDYFPQGVAHGRSFLGREEEINILQANILSNHHTLLLAPRRFGKTSLATHALKKLKLPYAQLDLHLAISSKSVEKKILRALTELLKECSPKNEQLLQLFQGFFKDNKKKWTLGFKGLLGLEIQPDDNEDAPDNILTGLKLIDHALAKKKKRAVLFVDEFQEIYQLDGGRQLQGAIRSFAQTSKQLVFVFSGSNRTMLMHMFDDKSQPMYELCERILLGRISGSLYREYIKKVSAKTWDHPMSQQAIDTILELSRCHPKRIYNLCYHLWIKHIHKEKPPNSKDVTIAWHSFIKQRTKDVHFSLVTKSPGQLKLLLLIASKKLTAITGKEAQNLLGIASSSIVKAAKQLEFDDLIEKSDDGDYVIVDPLVEDILIQDAK